MTWTSLLYFIIFMAYPRNVTNLDPYPDFDKHVGAKDFDFREPTNRDWTQVTTVLPDGRLVFDNVEPPPPLDPNVLLPGKNTRREEIEAAADGYRLKPIPKPIAIGKTKEFNFDPTVWVKEINDKLEAISPVLPQLPMVACMYGTIGSGKSTIWAANLLQAYMSTGVFKQIRFYSQTCANDPVFLTAFENRNPDVDFEAKEAVDFPFLVEKAREMKEFMSEVTKKAMIGKYHKKESPMNLIQQAWQEFDDTSHPYTNKDGTHHGRKPHVPNKARPATHVPELLRHYKMYPSESYHKNTAQIGEFMKHSIGLYTTPHVAKALFQNKLDATYMYSDQEVRMHTQDDHRSGIRDRMHAPEDITFTNMDQRVIDMNLRDPNVIHAQIRTQMYEKRLADPKGFTRKVALKPCLIFFDDSAYVFNTGPGAEFFKKWLPTIRHSACGVVFMGQQKTGFPRIVRTLTTHAMFAKGMNDQELQSVDEEYGGLVIDFEGKYYAATHPVGERDRDFLYCDFNKKKQYRSMDAELEPINGGYGMNPDATVPVGETKAGDLKDVKIAVPKEARGKIRKKGFTPKRRRHD